MALARDNQHDQFAATLVRELDLNRVTGLPADWVRARKAYVNLTNLPLRPVKTVANAKAALGREILDAAAAGKLTGATFAVDSVITAEALDRQVAVLNEAMKDAQDRGRVNLVLSVYDQHKDQLIRAVQSTFRTVTAKLWKLANDQDLVAVDPDLAAQIGGTVAQTMSAVIDLCRESQALNDLVRVLDDTATA
jgi:hypothetical protein